RQGDPFGMPPGTGIVFPVPSIHGRRRGTGSSGGGRRAHRVAGCGNLHRTRSTEIRMGYRIGIDVGGTFTDYLLLDERGGTRAHKVLPAPADPSQAVLQGLGELAAGAGLSLADFLRRVDIIVHGTTVTTNAVLTGRIARAGLLTTHGFRDALEMRRGVRESFYDNKLIAPAPLVRRRLRLPVRGRIDHRGREIEPLSLDDVERAVDVLQAGGVEAVAISFMHAYANAAHEEAAAELVARRMPDAYLSVSSRVLPQVRFY